MPDTTSGAAQTMESLLWYRENSKGQQKTIFLLALFLGISLICNILQVSLRPEPRYFGMTADLRLMPMPTLSTPIMTDAALKSWAGSAVIDSLTLTYLDWRTKLSACRQYFTPKAFAQFANTLVEEGHVPLLEQKKALLHTVLTASPTIVKSGVLKGILTWEIEVPVLLTYETSAGRVAANNIIATIRVQRVPTTDYERGVAISQLIATAAPAGTKR